MILRRFEGCRLPSPFFFSMILLPTPDAFCFARKLKPRFCLALSLEAPEVIHFSWLVICCQSRSVSSCRRDPGLEVLEFEVELLASFLQKSYVILVILTRVPNLHISGILIG